MPNVTFEEVYANVYVRESIEVLIRKTVKQYPMLTPHRDEMEQEMLIRLNAAMENYDHATGGASVETFARNVLFFAIKDFRRRHFSQKALARCYSVNFEDLIADVDDIGLENSAVLHELRMDIKSVMPLLTHVQQEIYRKLMEGCSVLRISIELKIPRHDIRRTHVPAIRALFHQQNFEKYLEI